MFIWHQKCCCYFLLTWSNLKKCELRQTIEIDLFRKLMGVSKLEENASTDFVSMCWTFRCKVMAMCLLNYFICGVVKCQLVFAELLVTSIIYDLLAVMLYFVISRHVAWFHVIGELVTQNFSSVWVVSTNYFFHSGNSLQILVYDLTHLTHG